MSTLAGVLTALKAQLKAYAGLSYISEVWTPARENVTQFPCLMLEPVRQEETEERHGVQTLRATVNISGYNKLTDPDLKLIGSGAIKGVLDIENEVKLAIDSDPSVAGNCIHAACKDTTYGELEDDVRYFSLNVEILYEQLTETRT